MANVIRGLPVEAAQVRLRLVEQRAGAMLKKLLDSAVANAKENFRMDPKQLRVTSVLVNEGPRLRRYLPRARGSASRLLKRTSHIEIVLSLQQEGERPALAGKKSEIETKKVEELRPEDVRVASPPKRTVRGRDTDAGMVKPAESPRGIRRLIERKHGGGE